MLSDFNCIVYFKLKQKFNRGIAQKAKANEIKWVKH